MPPLRPREAIIFASHQLRRRIERILFERASANVLRLNGRLFLIPASNETRGHLTTGNAKFYRKQLEEPLQTAPQRAM